MNVFNTMNQTYYQIVFLGDLTSPAYDAIKSKFFSLLADRMIDASLIDVMDGDRVVLPIGKGGYNPSKPTFAFYLGNALHNEKDVLAVKKLKDNADAIYPIFFTEGKFLDEVPKVLHPINGKLYSDAEIDAIVNVAFEELRLLRKRRRVFISYKRTDSTAVANQLYDVLSRHQFDVFLDSYAIRGSADFQQELYHRITDSDVLIQLNTQWFMDSKWCREEIVSANMHQIGVLQINWPGVDGGRANELCYRMEFTSTDFRRKQYKKSNSKLKKKVLEKVAGKVEAIRARNLAARYDNLKGEFIKEALRYGRTIIPEPLYLVEQKQDGKFIYYVPAVGVPQSIDFHESLKMIDKMVAEPAGEIYLLYDDLSVLTQWIEHLDWLRNSLEVKTIKKQEFSKWFQGKM